MKLTDAEKTKLRLMWMKLCEEVTPYFDAIDATLDITSADDAVRDAVVEFRKAVHEKFPRFRVFHCGYFYYAQPNKFAPRGYGIEHPNKEYRILFHFEDPLYIKEEGND